MLDLGEDHTHSIPFFRPFDPPNDFVLVLFMEITLVNNVDPDQVMVFSNDIRYIVN